MDGRASVQFAGDRRILFRVIRVMPWSTYEGWVWLDGYELNGSGEAVDRRSIFVQWAGLQRVRLVADRAGAARNGGRYEAGRVRSAARLR